LKIKLKALRVNADMTLDIAAEKLNVTVRTLQNWENYTTFPNTLQLVKICDVYGCTFDDIFLPDILAKS